MTHWLIPPYPLNQNCNNCEGEITGTKEEIFRNNCVIDGDGEICNMMGMPETKTPPSYFLCDLCVEKYKEACERNIALHKEEYGY